MWVRLTAPRWFKAVVVRVCDAAARRLPLRLVPLALRLAQLVLQLLDLLCVEQLRGTLGGTPAPARPAQPVALLLQLSGALALLLEEGFLLTQLLLQLCVDVVQPEVPRLRDSQLSPLGKVRQRWVRGVRTLSALYFAHLIDSTHSSTSSGPSSDCR